MKTTKLFTLAASMLLLTACGSPSTSSSSAAASSSAPAASSSAPAASSATSSAEVSSEPTISSVPKTTYAVSFNWNFEGAPAATVVNVEEGELVTPPTETVERTGYLFTGWFADAAASEAFDFETPIVAATTVYAGWIVNDENTISCTFYWNYDGASPEVYTTVYFQKGKRMTAPANPVRAGYNFRGWFADADCTEEFVVNARYEENQVAYAKWFVVYQWEAEYTQFTDLPEDDKTANEYGDKIGHGYSSDVSGTGLIFKDGNSDCKAENGYYVCDLYYTGAYLEFVVNADREVDDAVLIARLSAEYFDMNFVPSKDNDTAWDGEGTPDSGYDFEVNGVALDYGKIVIADVITGRDNPKKRDFTNHTITSNLHLNQGKNSIKLITKNSHRHDKTGTMAAMAPMIDCLYAYSDASLTFTEFPNGIKK